MKSEPASAFHLITAVWGEPFLDLFLGVCVPNQLAAGNLEALPAGSRYRVFTRAADVAALDASAGIARVRRHLPVDLVALDELDADGNRYDLMTRCHRRAVADAARAEAALMFLSGDVFMPEGTMRRLTELHRAGRRVVMTAGVRLAKETFIAALDARGTRALPPRQLVSLAVEHLHPYTQQHMADAGRFSRFPTVVYWRVGRQGLLARSFHLHPLMIDPVRRDVMPKGTIDGHYVARACPNFNDVYVAADSDDLAVFDLCPADRRIITAAGHRLKVWRAAGVASLCDAHQLEYFNTPIRMHGGDLDAEWQAVEAVSAQFAGDVVRHRRVGRVLLLINRRLERMRQLGDRWRRAWRSRRPRLRAKEVLRPLTLASHRARKSVRKAVKRRARQLRGVRPHVS